MLRSSIVRKALMAVTGLGMLGFVIVHMLGNLQIYLGRDIINSYAEFLHHSPELLWPARIGLLTILVIHLVCAFNLSQENTLARQTRYAFDSDLQPTLASRTMLMSGSIILIFLIYHLAHFTFMAVGLPNVDLVEHMHDGRERRDVYAMVIFGFSNYFIAGLYIVGQVLLGLHISHGASSMFQSVGINFPRYQWILSKLGPLCALVIVVGNVSIPVAVLSGQLEIPAQYLSVASEQVVS